MENFTEMGLPGRSGIDFEIEEITDEDSDIDDEYDNDDDEDDDNEDDDEEVKVSFSNHLKSYNFIGAS